MKHRLLCFLLGIIIAIVADVLLYLSFSIGCKSFDIWSWEDVTTEMFSMLFFIFTATPIFATQFIEKPQP